MVFHAPEAAVFFPKNCICKKINKTYLSDISSLAIRVYTTTCTRCFQLHAFKKAIGK